MKGAIKEVRGEPMEEIPKEIITKVSAGILDEEEINPGAKGGVRGEEVPPPQVPSIDSLLGDIYELQFQLALVNSTHYIYKVERDHYR